jgi:hypothetical protein
VARKIALSFVCGADISSKLIAWYGNGYGGFSHVDSILSDGTLAGARNDKIQYKDETLPAGFQIRPKDYEEWSRRDIVQLEVADQQAVDWEDWLRHQVGKPYDSGAIIGFLFGFEDHEKGHWICSAAGAGGLIHANVMPKPPVPLHQITPNSLHLMLYALGGKSILSYG